ncbi:MAG: ERCC4 domain-containing protein, partial [Candidatus Hodarchaeales archaeon]|jgi:Fanconi anemia group M protein
MNKALHIIVDHREPQKVKKRLIKLGMEIKEQQLEIADYILSNQVACERKTGVDLIASITDNRLFEQVDSLIETYEQPILILEDLESAFERTEWKKRKKHVFGALTYIFLRRQVPIVPTSSTAETAILLNRIASWVQEEHDDPIIARKSPKKRSLRDNQLFFLQGLQNTGQKKAKLLLKSFKNTPLKVIKAISDSNVIYTRTGNPKGVEGPFSNMKGFSSKYILENKKLLTEEDIDSSE